MSGEGMAWWKGCAIGCGILFLLGILTTVGGTMCVMRPFKEAIQTRDSLDEQFGEQAAYVPPPDGAVAPARIEAFLAVRSSLMGLCERFRATFGQFERMDRFGDQEDPPKAEVAREVLKTVKSALGVGPLLGDFYLARNRALLENGMGLGEYTYIYVVAYSAELDSTVRNDHIEVDGQKMSRATHRVLRQMLENQLAALKSAPMDPQRSAMLEELEREIRALEDDRDRLPWQGNLPSAIASALAPYRNELQEVFCRDSAQFELAKNRQKGLSIHSD